MADEIPRFFTEMGFAWTSFDSWEHLLDHMLGLSGKNIRSGVWITAPRWHLYSFVERMECVCVLHGATEGRIGAENVSRSSSILGVIIIQLGHRESDVAKYRKVVETPSGDVDVFLNPCADGVIV